MDFLTPTIKASGFASTHDASVDFGTTANALFVQVLTVGNVSSTITSVVIDPGGANITMTPEVNQTASSQIGASGNYRAFSYVGSLPTGVKTVRVTAADSVSRLFSWHQPVAGVSATGAVASNTGGTATASASVASASGRTVLSFLGSLAYSDAATVAGSGATAALARVLQSDGGGTNYLTGAILQTPSTGASTAVGAVGSASFGQWALSSWSITGTATAPTVTTQPGAQTVTAGSTATFTAAAAGTPTPTWQWQRSTNSGSTWADISGATGASYTTPATTVSGGSASSGDQYRAVATNSAGTATTAAATLTVNASATAPVITTQPGAQTVAAGSTATFTAAASGTPTPTWQWQRSTNSGSTWADISGATGASYTTPATTVSGGSANSGDQYRAVATNSAGTATAAAATLTVSASSNATVTVPGLAVWTGTVQAALTVPNVVVVRRSDRVQVLALANVVADGSGNLVISNAALAVGVGYMVLGFTTDGASSFKRAVTAA